MKPRTWPGLPAALLSLSGMGLSHLRPRSQEKDDKGGGVLYKGGFDCGGDAIVIK